MPTHTTLGDWAAVTDELRRFARDATVTASDDRIRVDFGAAHVEVSRDGRLTTGMPLHDFIREGDVDLVIDHDAGTLTVDAEDVTYTFRRPGG